MGTIYILGRVAAATKVMRPESALIIRTEMRKIKSQIARVPEPYSRLEKWLMNPLINSAYCFRGLQQYTIYHCVALSQTADSNKSVADSCRRPAKKAGSLWPNSGIFVPKLQY